MKKVSILLLLTVVLASFAFAIEGIGDFTGGLELGFGNVTGANNSALDVSIEPSIAFSRAFGAFGIAAKLGDVVYIPTDKAKNGTDKIGDELYFNVTPSYTLAAGPGNLGLSLTIHLGVPLTDEGYKIAPATLEALATSKFGPENKSLFFRINPTVTYGLDAGFGALSFALGTEHLQISKSHDWKFEPPSYEPPSYEPDASYGLDRLGIYLKAGAEFSFGLGVWIKPILGLQIDDDTDGKDTGLDKFVFDVHYGITEQIKAGVETAIPTYEKGIDAEGITITPRGEFTFGALGAYVKIELSTIGADGKDLQIKPLLGVSYKF